MTNPPRKKGTAAESAVVRELTAHDIDAARVTLHGNKDRGDVFIRLGKYLVTVEVKSYKSWASARQIEKWLDDADLECLNADADASILIVKRPGSGAANAGDWLCYMRADEWEWLAYGSPIGTPARREWVCVPLSHMVIVLRGVL
jgi:hypothetical protein